MHRTLTRWPFRKSNELLSTRKHLSFSSQPAAHIHGFTIRILALLCVALSLGYPSPSARPLVSTVYAARRKKKKKKKKQLKTTPHFLDHRSSMPKKQGSTLHHCPCAGGKWGNCEPNRKSPSRKRPYCPAHKLYCPHCPKEPTFIKFTESCPSCNYKHPEFVVQQTFVPWNVKKTNEAVGDSDDGAVEDLEDEGEGLTDLEPWKAYEKKRGRKGSGGKSEEEDANVDR